MAKWRYKIPIKQYFTENDTLAPEVVKNITDELKRAKDYSTNSDFQDIVLELEDAENLEQFNYSLDGLYDWADAELVWIE